MFLLTQLWFFWLLALALGALAAVLVQRACTARAAPKVAAENNGARDDAALAQSLRLSEAEQEIEVLRRQIASNRAELASVLNRRDLETDALRAELAAAQAVLKSVTSG